MPDRLLDANEVAELLNVPVSWVQESTRSGAIPHRELGRYKRYRLADVEEWLESCTKQYVHLAGVVFRDEAAALEQRMLGVPDSGTKEPQTA